MAATLLDLWVSQYHSLPQSMNPISVKATVECRTLLRAVVAHLRLELHWNTHPWNLGLCLSMATQGWATGESVTLISYVCGTTRDTHSYPKIYRDLVGTLT